MTVSRRLCLALAVVLLGSNLVLASPASASTGEALSLLNSSRTSAGLPALSSSGDLNGVAQTWAATIAAEGGLRHNPALSSQVSGWSSLAENVGTGGDVRAVHAAFMGSSGHRANILGSHTQVGVGVARGGGATWVVHVFRTPSGAPAPVPPVPPAPPAPEPTSEPTPAPAPAPAPAPVEPAAPAKAPAPTRAQPVEVVAPAPVAPPRATDRSPRTSGERASRSGARAPLAPPRATAAIVAAIETSAFMRDMGPRGPYWIYAPYLT